MKIAPGTVVSLEYILTDEQGEVLDTTEGREPLEYLHGYHNIIPGLEEALEGAEAGFSTEVTVEPDKGYGPVDPHAIFAVPIDRFPEDMEVTIGMTVVGETQSGPIRLTVRDIQDDMVVLDGNHPLAGKTLHFSVKVTDVRESTDQEKQLGFPAPRVE